MDKSGTGSYSEGGGNKLQNRSSFFFTVGFVVFYLRERHDSSLAVTWVNRSALRCRTIHIKTTAISGSFIHSFISGSTALCWALASSSFS
jgi:hypothetical protein